MKVRDCLALLRSSDTPAKERVRAMQALVSADKLHLVTDRERREIDKYVRWGMVSLPGVERLPIDEA